MSDAPPHPRPGVQPAGSEPRPSASGGRQRYRVVAETAIASAPPHVRSVSRGLTLSP